MPQHLRREHGPPQQPLSAKKAGGLALTAYAGFHGLGVHALAIPAVLNALEGWASDPTQITKGNVESVSPCRFSLDML
jgi:hypothetical protein